MNDDTRRADGMERRSHHRPEDVRPREDRPEDRDGDDWDRMVAAFRTAAPRGSAPPWLEQRVMAEIETIPERSAIGRVLDWLVRPEPIRVSPLAAALVAAGFAAVVLLPGRSAGPSEAGVAPGTDVGVGEEPVVYVQFMLEAPNATSVAVAGDFSEWEPAFAMDDADGDGVWTGRVPVRPGVHTYMFLIDGSQWQTDPRAERYRDDGFGNRNAVLAVESGV